MRKKVLLLLTGLIILFGAFSGFFSFLGKDLPERKPSLLLDGSNPDGSIFLVQSPDVYPDMEALFSVAVFKTLKYSERAASVDITSLEDPDGEILSGDRVGPEKEEGEKVKIALVIDDFGYSRSMAEDLAELPLKVTWAILPYLRGSGIAVSLAQSNKIPYLVHVPMQAFIDEQGGPYLIGEGMSNSDIREQMIRIIEDFPGALGINNHRGSRATSDRDIMNTVMEELSAAGKVFIDSRTSGSSVAYDVAREHGIPALSNNLFLDNSTDPEEIAAVFAKGLKLARRKGSLVAICHVRPGTLEFLKDLCTKDIDGVEFVTVPELLKARQGK